jgi:protease-4
MKRNPWAVIAAFSGLFLFLVVVAVGAAMYTAFGERMPSVSANSVLVLDVRGIILDSKPFLKKLQKYRDDHDIKAVVVRLDSPGGVVGPSQEIYEELKRTREMGKPVVASMGSLAASGAYYIAVGADKIVTNPGTITGSIGVIMEFANLGRLYDWAKVERYVVKSGAFKDMGSEFRAMTPAERQLLQGMMDNVHMQFKQAVAEGRHLKLAQVEKLADGRIFSGEQAVKMGLADSLGSLSDAIDEAGKLAGIKGKPEIFSPPPPRRRLLDMIMEKDEEESSSIERSVRHILGVDLVGKPLYIWPGGWTQSP